MSFFAPSNTAFGVSAANNAFFGSAKPTTSFGTAPSTPFGTGSWSNSIFRPSQPQSTVFGTPTNTGFGSGPSIFGVQTTTSAFGAGGSASQPNLFSNLGTKTTGAAFSFNPTPSNIGFGAPNTSFNFGQNTQPNFGFGQNTQPGLGFGQNTQPSVGFGQNTQQSTSAFGNPFGTSQPNAFSGFGAKTITPAFSINTPAFGQQMQPQQQQPQPLQQQPLIDETQAFYQSIFQCYKFGDERDVILAHLNYVQACMGRGKGYYSQVFPPVIYTPMNPYCRFKAVSYSLIFSDSNEDGQVILSINKNPENVQSGETHIISTFQNIFNRPNIVFKISDIKRSGIEESSLILVAEDRSTNRRIPAYDLTVALIQPFVKTQLDNLGILQVFPKVKPSPEQLKLYLDTAPFGIDPRVWRQAQYDNPIPSFLIPVPILGIEALKKKVDWQEAENQRHQSDINRIQQEIGALTNRYDSWNTEIQHLKRRHYTISHRILSVILRLDSAKMAGVQLLQPVEEQLKKHLESMDSELNQPLKFRGLINDVLSQVRQKRIISAENQRRPQEKIVLDKETVSEIKSFLVAQQKSAKHLVEATDVDFKNLNCMKIGYEELKTKLPKL